MFAKVREIFEFLKNVLEFFFLTFKNIENPKF